nr:MAG TPA: hypothetical protein [Caudoviricetes sp.]
MIFKEQSLSGSTVSAFSRLSLARVVKVEPLFKPSSKGLVKILKE